MIQRIHAPDPLHGIEAGVCREDHLQAILEAGCRVQAVIGADACRVKRQGTGKDLVGDRQQGCEGGVGAFGKPREGAGSRAPFEVEEGLGLFLQRYGRPPEPFEIEPVVRALGYLGDVDEDGLLPATKDEIEAYWSRRQPEIVRNAARFGD